MNPFKTYPENYFHKYNITLVPEFGPAVLLLFFNGLSTSSFISTFCTNSTNKEYISIQLPATRSVLYKSALPLSRLLAADNVEFLKNVSIQSIPLFLDVYVSDVKD